MKKLLGFICLFIFINKTSHAQIVQLVRVAAGAGASRALSDNGSYDLRKRTTSEFVVNGETIKYTRTPKTEIEKMKNSKKKVAAAALEMEAIESELEKCRVILENKQVLTQIPDLENNFNTLKENLPGFKQTSYREELAFYKKMTAKFIE